MKHYAIPLTTNYSPFTIIKGNNEYQQQLHDLTSTAWLIAYTALWNGETFSTTEKEKAMDLIKDFIKQQANPKKAYAEFVQRVLLARQYILTHPGAYAPIPSQWLNAANKNGFAGTQRWYASLQNIRQSLPLYKLPVKAFAEAVLETIQSDAARDFHFWRSYFVETQSQNLLNLFLSTMANGRHCK